MASRTCDYVIVSGGSAGCALANRCRPTRVTTFWCSNRAATIRLGTCSYTCPAALPFPIGSRFYDWKYEAEPEPHTHGQRIYHARARCSAAPAASTG